MTHFLQQVFGFQGGSVWGRTTAQDWHLTLVSSSSP
jgi:hypothetical protein